jgi:class 3 adenylate cyclase/tetratricopeptide (TPR) repeat protein
MEDQGTLRCPSCGHGNREEARFCDGCGGPLARTCAACGMSLRPAARFCDGCGEPVSRSATAAPTRNARDYTPSHLVEKILTSRGALEGERKQVTVLFADVQGSMELAEQLDPEEWHGIMDRFFQLLAEGVHRYEGTVNQYTGDGIMALFGAPIAHEDHAQRACWAALHLQDALRGYAHEVKREHGLTISVRMGINSGEVVVGKIGDDLRMDYTALGHTVGLAQRMEQLADPGSVYLSEHTGRLVEGWFRLRDLGPLAVKGAREPPRVYQLEGAGPLRTRFDVSRRRGLSRFVGREAEMAALEAALDRVLGGQGLIVGIVAEPGVGKSRLCHELAGRCRARGIPFRIGRGVPHGKAIPLLPIMDAYRSNYDITEQDSDEMARDKIAGRLVRLDPDLADAVPVMFQFLGVPDPRRPAPPMSPEALQRAVVDVTTRLFTARARLGESVVMLFEDLHWFDTASDAFLAAISDVIPTTPVLQIRTFRPEYQAEWMGKTYYEQLTLRPLGAEALDELLRDLLGDDPSIAGLAARIRERTGGNPFFIEEVVQQLAESGALAGAKGAHRLTRPIDDITIPPTVQSVLAARIDRLAEGDKAVLQTAAVIGKEFPEPVLRRVTELSEAELASVLGRLAAAELVYETAAYPDIELAFKHPLTQEVAYRSQLAARRARVHAAVARAVEELYPDKLDERAALLAHHWEGAGDAATAAVWHGRAAEWVGMRDRGAMDRHWRQARTLLDAVPESPETLRLGLQARIQILVGLFFLGQTEEEATALFTEGMAIAARLDEPLLRVRLLALYGVLRLSAGVPDDAITHLTEALRLADASGDAPLRASVRGALADSFLSKGRLRKALALSEEAEALRGIDFFSGSFSLGQLFSSRARMLAQLGHLEEAARVAEQGMEAARERKDPEAIITAHMSSVRLCEITGDAEAAFGHARQAMALAEAVGLPRFRHITLQALGQAHLLKGQWSEAVEAVARALALLRELRSFEVARDTYYLTSLAEAYLGAGDLGRARETADMAVAVARQRQLPVREIAALLARARVLLASDGAGAAPEIETVLRDATALVEKTEARAYAPFVHVERANVARLVGDEAARQRELGEAHRLFTAIGAPIRAEQVARELGSSVESPSEFSSTSRT